MYIQVVNFRLTGMNEDEFRALCDELAPVFANVPGLISKVWLADSENGIYGGVYTWQDKQALDTFLGSDLFSAVLNNPNFTGIVANDFGVLEEPTRVTRGMASAVV